MYAGQTQHILTKEHAGKHICFTITSVPVKISIQIKFHLNNPFNFFPPNPGQVVIQSVDMEVYNMAINSNK